MFFRGVSDLTEYAVEPTVVSLRAGADAHKEWAQARARHHPYGSRARRGRAAGTLRAIGTAQALTLSCQRDSALVHAQAARRQARAAGRSEYEPGDGCSSRLCSRNFRPAQFLRGQEAMAAGLECGERLLISWPATLSATKVVLQPARAACTVAEEARAAAPCLAARLRGGGGPVLPATLAGRPDCEVSTLKLDDEGEAPATEQCGDAPEESEAEGDDAGRPMRVSHARDPPRPTSRSCLSPH